MGLPIVPSEMKVAPGGSAPKEEVAQYSCEDCGQPFKNAQGLAGHRRLAHSSSTRADLEARAGALAERETAAKRREAESARQVEAARRREVAAAAREREIAETGPAALGLSQCPKCRGWFDSSKERNSHLRSAHPIEDEVAEEVGRSRQRVEDVWREACRKQAAHTDRPPEWIVGLFWAPTDQKILRALLARNATFRASEGGG
jgi:hypothetical protein